MTDKIKVIVEGYSYNEFCRKFFIEHRSERFGEHSEFILKGLITEGVLAATVLANRMGWQSIEAITLESKRVTAFDAAPDGAVNVYGVMTFIRRDANQPERYVTAKLLSDLTVKAE